MIYIIAAKRTCILLLGVSIGCMFLLFHLRFHKSPQIIIHGMGEITNVGVTSNTIENTTILIIDRSNLRLKIKKDMEWLNHVNNSGLSGNQVSATVSFVIIYNMW